jgi:hypothetical protein
LTIQINDKKSNNEEGTSTSCSKLSGAMISPPTPLANIVDSRKTLSLRSCSEINYNKTWNAEKLKIIMNLASSLIHAGYKS